MTRLAISLTNFKPRAIAPRKPSEKIPIISPVIAFASSPESTSRISAIATAKLPDKSAISPVTSKIDIHYTRKKSLI